MTGAATILGILVLTATAALSAGMIVVLRPLLRRYTLAHPNERSSHKLPTPQGGGIAVVVATIVAVAVVVFSFPNFGIDSTQLVWVLVAASALAVVGATDDIRPLEAPLRLSLQTIAVFVVVTTLPIEHRVFPILPLWFERGLLLLGGVWFVNLVNFMDGIDWMTVAEVVPVTAGLSIFGLMGALPPDAILLALALCGAMIGFAPFNRPVARLFLGDVGSLPIGLLLGWLLVTLAGNGHFTSAFLLPLYYVADATITLLRRLATGAPVMQAHRSHFYQRAVDRGLSVHKIIGCIFGVNIALVGLATASLVNASSTLHLAAVTVGSALVGAVLWNFSRTSC